MEILKKTMNSNMFKTMLTIVAIIGVVNAAAPPPYRSDMFNDFLLSTEKYKKIEGTRRTIIKREEANSYADYDTISVTEVDENEEKNIVSSKLLTPLDQQGDVTLEEVDKKSSIFDRIFAIPVNILDAIKHRLIKKQQTLKDFVGVVSAVKTSDNGNVEHSVITQTHGKVYDTIINIPITIVRTITNMLNYFLQPIE